MELTQYNVWWWDSLLLLLNLIFWYHDVYQLYTSYRSTFNSMFSLIVNGHNILHLDELNSCSTRGKWCSDFLITAITVAVACRYLCCCYHLDWLTNARICGDVVCVLLLHFVTKKNIWTVVFHMGVFFYPFQWVNGISFLYKKGSSNCENWSSKRLCMQEINFIIVCVLWYSQHYQIVVWDVI
jgi:hypothetical protein